MWKWTGELELAAHLPQRVPLAAGQVRGAQVLGVRRHVDPAQAEALGSTGLPHAGLDVPRRKDGHGEEPVARSGLELGIEVVEDLGAHGSQLDVLDHLGQFLATQTDDSREDDLGEDADLVEELESGHGVVGARMGLVDLPLVESLEGSALHAVAVDDTAGSGPSEDLAVDHPGRLTVDRGDMGYPVLPAAGARLVHRSWGSVKWVSASTTLTWSSGRAMRSSSLCNSRERGRLLLVTVAAFPVTGNQTGRT